MNPDYRSQMMAAPPPLFTFAEKRAQLSWQQLEVLDI